MSFRIYPSIDLRNGLVVRLKQGDFAQQTDYPVDPIAQAQSYAHAGATIMHLVDLDGAKAGKVVQTELIEKIIRHAGIPVQVGGGVRSTEDVESLLSLGAARVVIGTAALENWSWFQSLAHTPAFAHKLVLAIDAKDGIIATRGWTQSSGQSALDIAKQVTHWPLAALLYTDVAVDGMLTGPNLPHTTQLAQSTSIPILASGGVGQLSHLQNLKQTGAQGVIIGRALYERKFTLRQALELAEQ